ncbi:hypothetical protein J437_LFUL007536 [Ladona fulva]|uniref:Major facilitator superfamily (MFS) profile domain-containing protein n=1 Tax=Ladona fulva TaxID=123851 RepID=A0A8K0K3P5_LADFU|nr:hypothetical protein J437_LFUL007536 [Ladona fulva]
MLPQISDPGSTLTLTPAEASWVASLGVISNPLGAVAAGAASEVFGRRAAIRMAAAPYLIGWLLIALADDFLKLCIGRFVSGVAVGMATSSYLYVAEVSGAQLRGTLCASGPVFVSIGVLLVYVAGAFTNWTTVAALSCAASALAYLAATAILPETPPWLVSKGRTAEAREALRWFRGNVPTSEVDKELAALAANGTTPKEDDEKKGNFFSKMVSLFSQPQVWKPFILLTFFFLFQEASGIYVLLYYAVDLFRSLEAGSADHRAEIRISGGGGEGRPIAAALVAQAANVTVEHAERVHHSTAEDHSSGLANGFLPSIAVAGVRLVASIGGAALMQRFGRRQLAMTSGLGMALSMAVAGGYEFVFTSVEQRPAPWVPLACVLTHVCISMIGFLQLPWVMTSELFPQNARGIAGGSVSALAHLLIFTSVKTYPDLEAWAGVPCTLWLFAGAAAVGALFVYAFLPETKGKTLSEIEDEFAGRRDSVCHRCELQKTGDPLSVIIMKANFDHHSKTPQHKSLTNKLKQCCFSLTEDEDQSPYSGGKESTKGESVNDSPLKLPADVLDNSIGATETCQTKKGFLSLILHRRKEDYIAGIESPDVSPISIISVDPKSPEFPTFKE